MQNGGRLPGGDQCVQVGPQGPENSKVQKSPSPSPEKDSRGRGIQVQVQISGPKSRKVQDPSPSPETNIRPAPTESRTPERSKSYFLESKVQKVCTAPPLSRRLDDSSRDASVSSRRLVDSSRDALDALDGYTWAAYSRHPHAPSSPVVGAAARPAVVRVRWSIRHQ